MTENLPAGKQWEMAEYRIKLHWRYGDKDGWVLFPWQHSRKSEYDTADNVFFYFFEGNGSIDFNRALYIDELDEQIFEVDRGCLEFVSLFIFHDGQLISHSGDQMPEFFYVDREVSPEVKAFWERKSQQLYDQIR